MYNDPEGIIQSLHYHKTLMVFSMRSNIKVGIGSSNQNHNTSTTHFYLFLTSEHSRNCTFSWSHTIFLFVSFCMIRMYVDFTGITSEQIQPTYSEQILLSIKAQLCTLSECKAFQLQGLWGWMVAVKLMLNNICSESMSAAWMNEFVC